MPSHLSAWAIDQWLAAHTVLPPLGSAFKRAETTYGVNAEYLVAHAMEETGFGSSYIAQEFNNLFGWNAIDSDPVGNATHFTSFEESVGFVAERVATLYLSPTGAFYGGAPTLAGMSRYATGANWAANIARIADQMETQLPTLRGLGVVLAPPVVGSSLITGSSTTITLEARNGVSIPDGLHAAFRWVSLVPVPGSVPAGIGTVVPAFGTSGATTSGGTLTTVVATPPTPGSYRLEVRLLDSDGTPLTEPGFQSITTVGRIVNAPMAVEYGLRQNGTDLVIAVTNVGSQPIVASADSQAGATAGPTPSGATTGATTASGATTGASGATTASRASGTAILVAWLLGADGQPRELFRVPLLADLAPGATWTVPTPIAPLEDALPGTIVIRLLGAGDPTLLDGSVPGAFVVNPDASSDGSASVNSPGAPTPLGVLPAVGIDFTTAAATAAPTSMVAGGESSATTPATPTLSASLDANTRAINVRISNEAGLFLPADAAPGSAPTAMDGLMNGATAPAPPSVEAVAVPLIGPDTRPIALTAAISADPAAPGSASAVLDLPPGAAGARRSIYLVVVRAQAQVGAPSPDSPPLLLWAAAPTTPAPADASAPSSLGSQDEVTSAP